jgi:polypeptide N-acetylgalactosaminyltransferase
VRQIVSLKQVMKYFISFFVLVTILSMMLQQSDPVPENYPNSFLPRPLRQWGDQIKKQFIHRQVSFFDGAPKNSNRRRIDWHDYNLLKAELTRRGPGENGTKVIAHNIDLTMQKAIFQANGYNGLVSDMISVNRSLPDIRHALCKKKLYLAELPSVSVVVPFYNEHFSVLMRTAHSVINRSPPHILKEIILVNDFSSKEFLWKPLDNYVAANFSGKVKVVHLKSRSGLILARMAGAREATGDVMVFLDSHTEPLINWLPPLLEPIAENYRTCVCPLIDVIDYNHFEYTAQDDGQRGVFDWKFIYKRLPLPKEDLAHPTTPFKSPIMAGGLFAISSKFFWELGGYDEGLDIWGGEQYELSFKIWQCGGQMFDAPCSRVGHIYRGSMPFSNPRGDKDFVTRNFKRVAEVWMDEYKQYLYMRKPNLYNRMDAGDLTKQKEIRNRLQCKSFKWFLEEVAYDLIPKFPLVEPEPFAKGVVRAHALK